MLRFMTVILFSVAFLIPAQAQKFIEKFDEWVVAHSIHNATFIVMKEGRIIAQKSIGNFSTNEQFPLASLSKAITAQCIDTLVQRGKLTYSTPLSKALQKLITQNNLTLSSSIAQVTLHQLITHTSGLTREGYGAIYEDNPTLALLMRERGGGGEPQKFRYSNAGYWLLGSVVEEQAGQPYETYCNNAVLKPLGVSGFIAPERKLRAAGGGWVLSGSDYLKFFDAVARKGNAIGEDNKGWGLGVQYQRVRGGINMWHFGQLAGYYKGQKLGTIAYRTFDSTLWFLAASPGLSRHQREGLNKEMLQLFN
jgi:CubicO group peptidase (beta-lactamase class C family)